MKAIIASILSTFVFAFCVPARDPPEPRSSAPSVVQKSSFSWLE